MQGQPAVITFFRRFVRVRVEAVEELAVVRHGTRAAGTEVVEFRGYHTGGSRCCEEKRYFATADGGVGSLVL
jgi:hypothetical protein